MAYQYTYIDGERVEVNVAAGYLAMKHDFDIAFAPKRLYIERQGGTRTRAEQITLFTNAFHVQWEGGGFFNDVRWWDGKRWVRHDPGGTVAPPGESNHEEDGPNGPRSLDIGSTGGPGAGSFGTPEQAWLAANAHRYGFENEGYAFNEAWHKKFIGQIGIPAPASVGGTTTFKPAVPEEEDDDMKNSGAYYTPASNAKTIIYLLFNTGSGWWHEFSNGPGNGPMPSTYNNPLAGTLDTGTWAKITESHARVLKDSLDKVRQRA